MLYLDDIIGCDSICGNMAIIGRRDCGKTTYLMSYVKHIYRNTDKRIILFDSATEHADKSIIYRLSHINKDTSIIKLPDKSENILCCDDIKNTDCYRDIKNSDNRIIMFDVAEYLEKSYETNCLEERNRIRSRYIACVCIGLRLIYDLLDEYVIVFDEIEFNQDIVRVLNACNLKNNFFISAVHDIRYLYNYNNIDKVNVDSVLLFKNNYLLKKETCCCGNACVEIIGSIFYNQNFYTSHELKWCCDIGSFLADKSISIDVFCYNSNLYNSYVNGRDMDFCGIQMIKSYENVYNNVIERPLTKEILYEELTYNVCGIYCVSSVIYNNMEGNANGHYVVLFKKNNQIYTLNPKRRKVEKFITDIDKHINACQSFGNWRILCN